MTTKQHDNQALQQLQDAIKGIAIHEKTGYLQAVDQAPHLIASETDPNQFLRFEKGNVWAAAKRLVTYWEWRTLLFRERAFLPMMDLTGNGALTERDIEYLKSGFLVLLPKMKSKKGQSVVFLNKAKTRTDLFAVDNTIHIRAVFYISCRVSIEQKEDPENASVVGLMYLSSWKQEPFHRSCDSKGIVRDSMPFKVERLHLLLQPNEEEKNNFLNFVIPYFVNYYSNLFSFSKVVAHYSSNGRVHLKNELLSHGFSEDGLPELIGGTWSYSNMFRDHSAGEANELLHPSAKTETLNAGKLVKNAVIMLLNETIGSMPCTERQAYQEALFSHPNLVNQESNPLEFLIFENFDVWKAALRLTRYWQWRRSLFRERAFLPMMDLSGSGALEKAEILFIKSGIFAVLPKDANGDLVAVMDRSRIGISQAELDNDRLLRLNFWRLEYMRSELRRPENVNAGIGLMGIHKSLVAPPFLSSKNSWLTLYNEAIPIKLKWFRYIVLLDDLQACNTWRKIIFPALQETIINTINSFDVRLYCDMDPGSLKKKLLPIGMTEGCTPQAIGGVWSYDSFDRWFDGHAKPRSPEERDDPMETEPLDSNLKPFSDCVGSFTWNGYNTREKGERSEGNCSFQPEQDSLKDEEYGLFSDRDLYSVLNPILSGIGEKLENTSMGL